MLQHLKSLCYSSQSAKAVWVEIRFMHGVLVVYASQSAKAVWVEIGLYNAGVERRTVTVCEGCVG